METSLRYDPSRRSLCLFAKERFASSDDVILTVRSLARSPSTRLARLVSLETARESSVIPRLTTGLVPRPPSPRRCVGI